MDSFKRSVICALLLTWSATASLLFVSGVDLGLTVPAKWILYFPSYGTLYLLSLVWHLIGIRVVNPLLFMIGVTSCAVCFAIFQEKLPKNVVYAGVGILFFVILVITGRAVFVQVIYIPQSPRLSLTIQYITSFVEFLVALVLLYLVLDDVDIPFQKKMIERDN